METKKRFDIISSKLFPKLYREPDIETEGDRKNLGKIYEILDKKQE